MYLPGHPSQYRGAGLWARCLTAPFGASRRGKAFPGFYRNPALAAFYARSGYRVASRAGFSDIIPAAGEISREMPPLSQINAIYEQSVRESAFEKRGADEWSRVFSTYDFFFRRENGRLSAYCACEKRESGLFVLEAFGNDAKSLCAAAAFAENAEKCRLMRAQGGENAFCCVRAADKTLENGDIYLNLYFN